TGHWLLAVDVLLRLHRVDRHLGVPVVGRGDADDVDIFLIEYGAVVLADVLGVVLIDAAAFGGGVEAAALLAAEFGVAVPHVADGDGGDGLAGVAHGEDGVDVLLAAAADAEEANADLLVGAVDALIAGGGQGEGGAGGGTALQKVAAIRSLGHGESPEKEQ